MSSNIDLLCSVQPEMQDRGSGCEDERPPDTTNKALPALMILKDLLGHKYFFHEASRTSTWNEDELVLHAKVKISLPMADTIPRSHPAALEHTFGPKSVIKAPRKAVKRFWPGPWPIPAA